MPDESLAVALSAVAQAIGRMVESQLAAAVDRVVESKLANLREAQRTAAAAPLLLSSDDAAKVLGVSARCLWGHTAPRGTLPVVKIGGANRYVRSDLDAWIEAQKHDTGIPASSNGDGIPTPTTAADGHAITRPSPTVPAPIKTGKSDLNAAASSPNSVMSEPAEETAALKVAG